MCSGENERLGKEQRTESISGEGAGGREEWQSVLSWQHRAAWLGEGQCQLHSALSAAAGAGMSNGLCWRHSWGGCSEGQQEDQSQTASLLQVLPRALGTPASVGLFFREACAHQQLGSGYS